MACTDCSWGVEDGSDPADMAASLLCCGDMAKTRDPPNRSAPQHFGVIDAPNAALQ
jgi:hypothetical protein